MGDTSQSKLNKRTEQMRTLSVFECDFCKKLYRSKSSISKHEKICFRNPDTKSCVTCQHLSDAMIFNGKEISEHEYKVLNYEVEGTFVLSNYGDECTIPVLNPEWTYLYDQTDYNTYCRGKDCILKKLTHNCEYHKPIQDS